MKEIKISAGTHITFACKQLEKAVVESREPAFMVFNDIRIVAGPGENANELLARFNAEIERQADEYKNSPEGIAAAKKRQAEIADKQGRADMLIGCLESVNLAPDAVMSWAKQFAEVADDIDVHFNRESLAKTLEAKGYIQNQHVGETPESLNNRQRMGEWVIGQVINCLRHGMPPHPITIRFCEKYFALKA